MDVYSMKNTTYTQIYIMNVNLICLLRSVTVRQTLNTCMIDIKAAQLHYHYTAYLSAELTIESNIF